MAVEILSGVLTGPQFIESGDVIVVSDDAVITSDEYNSGALRNDYNTRGEGISIIVDGRINNTGDYGDAIRLYAVFSEEEYIYSGKQLLQVREDGVLRGFKGISLRGGADNVIETSGRVVGEFCGIEQRGGSVSITNSGIIASETNAAIYLIKPDTVTITNTGTLTNLGKAADEWDAGSGIYMSESSSSVINNHGLIDVRWGGMYLVNALDLTVLNSGTIRARNDQSIGVGFGFGSKYHIENTGTIKGNDGLYSRTSTGSIVNSGRIVGEQNGIFVAGFSDEDQYATIHNTGVIKGAYSLFSYDIELEVTNLGVMDGNILVRNVGAGGAITLKNAGRIAGEVRLGDDDDLYHAIDDGYVTRFVYGGDGQDRLTGGSRADDLRGGDGDDILRGKDGADHLQGGQGNDKLNGGKDADRLNGSAGDDLLRGAKGDDTLKGGTGNDLLFGGAGMDSLEGGKGKDILEGGRGNDTLRGDGGGDVFVFGMRSGTDDVRDFTDGQDMLRLVGHTGGFDDLTIFDSGANLWITHGGGVILLIGHAGTVLTAADFEFV